METEIALPYSAVLEAVDLLEAQDIYLLGWEALAVYPDGGFGAYPAPGIGGRSLNLPPPDEDWHAAVGGQPRSIETRSRPNGAQESGLHLKKESNSSSASRPTSDDLHAEQFDWNGEIPLPARCGARKSGRSSDWIRLARRLPPVVCRWSSGTTKVSCPVITHESQVKVDARLRGGAASRRSTPRQRQ